MVLSQFKLLLLFLLISNYQSFSQKPIDTTQVVYIGGIKQFIQVKARDDSRPILLFLHGGPGSSLMKHSQQMSGKLQQHFIVVHWDQRQTGQTLGLNKSPETLTLEIFNHDTHDLIETLLKQFQQPKLYLAGYSWGSGMGFYIADKYPELLYAYIAISPVIDQWRSENISLAMMKESMGRKAAQELSLVKIPFENWEQLYTHRKWLLKHGGEKFVKVGMPKSFVQGWASTWFNVWLESCDKNLFETLPTIKCPVYFFAGRKDFNTNYSITQQYFDAVAAPKKELFLFDDAGHGLPETHSGRFQDIIISKILPETVNLTTGTNAR